MGRPAIRLAIQLTFELTRPSEDIEHGASARQGLLCAPYTSFSLYSFNCLCGCLLGSGPRDLPRVALSGRGSSRHVILGRSVAILSESRIQLSKTRRVESICGYNEKQNTAMTLHKWEGAKNTDYNTP